MSEAKWRKVEDWVGSQVEDSWVMLNLLDGDYVALNETAAAVWHALDRPRSEDELVDMLTEGFEIARERCRVSVAALLKTLADDGLVAREP